ncbi:hypothetical protein M378DRAFT_18511 [Amanita muscaria Koide BX008]|uniref:Uncharacterized protein n=1 Tax=Amanita muscaria (strain Koide BX008) TaxID=946122 RepID=A0A0C2WE10_AMAMK|nr:hypothetical protein M378DRAFT_18511 [Amanita muscaria Koide BX008]
MSKFYKLYKETQFIEKTLKVEILGTVEWEAWNIFITEEYKEDPTFSYNFSKEQRQTWEQYRDTYLNTHKFSEELEKLSVAGNEEQPKMSTSKAKAIDDDDAKLYRQLASSLEDYDGNCTKFANWWTNMQMYMMGEAAAWAEVKKQQILEGKLSDWDMFKTDIENWFKDPAREQTAQYEIHTLMSHHGV